MNWEDKLAERELKEFVAEAHRSLPEDTAIDFCRRVMDTCNAGVWVGDGGETLLDLFSASGVVAVFDKLSEGPRAKLARLPLAVQVDLCFKIINKVESRS